MESNQKITIRDGNPKSEKYLNRYGKWTSVQNRAAVFSTTDEALIFADNADAVKTKWGIMLLIDNAEAQG